MPLRSSDRLYAHLVGCSAGPNGASSWLRIQYGAYHVSMTCWNIGGIEQLSFCMRSWRRRTGPMTRE